MFVLIYLLIALVTLIAYLLHRNFNYWKSRGIPHDPPHPIFGNTVGFRKTRTLHAIDSEFYNKYRKSGNPFVGFYFVFKPTAFILDTKLAKNILIKDFSNFSDRGVFHNERDDPLSGHIFAVDGKRWKELRHKLTPTFTSGKMKFMYPTINKVADEFINVMSEQVPSKSGGAIIEIKDLMARFTTDVIGTCAFGVECNSLKNPSSEFRLIGAKVLSTPRHGQLMSAFIFSFPKLAVKLGCKILRDDVHNFFMGLVNETVSYRERENIKRNDFLDMLIELKNKGSITLENGEVIKGMDMNELAAQVFVFFLAGFETSSSTMGFALYELAQHTDIQDRLRSEISDVLADYDQKLTYDCVKDFRYLDQILSETLRLYTIVPHLDRVAQNDYVVPGNSKFVIEKGTSVLIPACAIHRDPDLYPEPEKFDPDRFSPEQVAARDSVEWLPFGDGPRNCIGMRFGQMQARLGLARLISNFKFSVCDETEMPLKYNPKSFVLSSVSGIYLRVERV